MMFDLHIHSKYSYDSFSEPEAIVKTARKIGLNGIAIVDHDSIKGALEAQKYAGSDFFVINGEEIYTKECEIIGLFLKEEVHANNVMEAINEIKKQGGIAVLPHPYKRAATISENILENIDAIEAFNSRGENSRASKNNERAFELAKKYSLPVICGSDAHFLFEIGRSVCTIDTASDMTELKNSILTGKTKIGGRTSSLLNEFMSQIVKMIKLRKPSMLLRAPRKIIKMFFCRDK
ncbi:MAG: PHP domain-containing protein [Elusimicrobia bacterium]|nr:PHP domain-containing protein [Candidatus Liberimonas magnetica]